MKRNVVKLVFVATLACLCACRKGEKKSFSSEALLCHEQISEFRKMVQHKDRRFQKKAFEIRSQVQELKQRSERIQLFRELATIVKSISLKDYSVAEKREFDHLFYEIPETIASSLFADGALEGEAGDLIVDGFHKYRELCSAYGSETDMSDGNDRWAQYRRKVAKYKRHEWEHSLRYFETVGIKYVFEIHSPDAAKRFLERWHKEFGCHNKDCPEWKNLSTNAPQATLAP